MFQFQFDPMNHLRGPTMKNVEKKILIAFDHIVLLSEKLPTIIHTFVLISVLQSYTIILQFCYDHRTTTIY